MSDKEIRREMISITNLNGWGMVGFIIPLLGMILFAISSNRAGNLLFMIDDKDQIEKYSAEIESRKRLGNNMFGVCLLLFVFESMFWLAVALH